ncbi:MAG: hypothetical protein HQ488_02320 [Parcubacteria group bacterium]|nr:hypothetical protein [Parcubacteria group bacterium]
MKFLSDHSLLDEEIIKQTAESLADYRSHLEAVSKKTDYTDPESSIQLPFDYDLLSEVQTAAEKIKTATLQYVVVIGIGGSNLGTQAVYNAIAGSMSLLYDRMPKLLFLDTVSDERMTAVVRILSRMPSKEDFAIITISKSGGTTETIANTEVLWKSLDKQFGDIRDRLCFITDEGSKLWNAAKEHKVHRISIPELVGGRYSVLSAVGLVSLLLGKIDIEDLREGARVAVADGVSEDLSKNHSLASAVCTHLHAGKGRNIHNSFVYATKLESLGKWYRQLMGESIGKEKDLDGNVVNAGVTPIVSIGSTDLHSMAQLYYGGPDDKFTNIVYSFKGDINLVPRELKMHGLVENIGGKSLENITTAIVGGVKAAYELKQRPYIEIDMEGITPYELGYYLQFRMIEMMYLAKLMNVNAFNQPAVEDYKEATRKLLKG